MHDFLVDRFGTRDPEMSKLRARDIIEYLERYRSQFSIGRSKLLVTALRSFLRYALIKGMIVVGFLSFLGIATLFASMI
jgi:hypothetical protein